MAKDKKSSKESEEDDDEGFIYEAYGYECEEDFE